MLKIKSALPYITVLSIFLISPIVDAISLSQSIDRTDMAFEDSAKFEITVEWPGAQMAYRFVNPLNPYIDRLKVGRFSSSITSTGTGEDERTTKKFTYVLIPTSSGNGKVDPITISYLTWPDSVAGELITEPVSITIAEQKIVAKSNKLPIWAPIIGGILLLGSGTAFYLARSRAVKSRPPVKTPSQAALDDLTKLKAESGNDLKKFQTGVYNILMTFLKAKYDINVSGESEERIEELLKKAPLAEQTQREIAGWLIKAERDKFRPVEASPGETVRLETELRRF
ncbi:MAG TPA: BatD family protein, partial [candidate division Zixibacteria bacterium]|nr:BatD family protein [candidate division Zixibacteria bacterium]